jgi:hypothetical protein
MAEGLLAHDAADRFQVESAGTRPGQVRSEAITVMKELGIDISGHHPPGGAPTCKPRLVLAEALCRTDRLREESLPSRIADLDKSNYRGTTNGRLQPNLNQNKTCQCCVIVTI